jgi:Fas apoptotic inhibitory molecule (FAIM1)
MKFKIKVGEVEKHLVEFSFNQLAGSLLIKVDDKPIHRSVRLFNEPLAEVYHFVVGQEERSDVRIEKMRKQLFGYRNSVYVDGRLANVFVGV